MKIEMYTRDGCEFCENAKTYLTTMGLEYQEYRLEYQEYNLTKGQSTREEVLRRLEVKEDQKISLPVVFIENLYIGGYDGLVSHFAALDLTQAELKQMLRYNAVSISFMKSDRSIRTMLCTTQVKYIEQPKPVQFNNGEITEFNLRKTKKRVPYVLSVWDVDKGAWRSFRVDRVLTWKIVDEVNVA